MSLNLLRETLPGMGEAVGFVEQRLRSALLDATSEAKEIFFHLLDGGGKRIRPVLTLLSASLFTQDVSEVVPVAAAMELIHMATLVHDDVIDVADTRRGRATINYVWGNQQAVLAGDALLARALCLLAEVGLLEVVRIVSRMIHGMCEGELTQNANLGNLAQTEAEYFERIEKKTALFFSVCCQAGALVARGPSEDVEAMGEYGRLLGLAFQVIDDVLDFTADAEVLGKPVGSDFVSGVITLPVIHILRQSKAQAELSLCLASRSSVKEAIPQVLEIVREYGGVDYSLQVAQTLVSRAKERLPKSGNGDIRKALISVADMVLHRTH
ncbi:MAG: polyprenyl synthetase family protein [Firmicutes bacterium]|nr:polyprenyl synthetase family protein [Bacillota bacterium]